MKTLQFLSLVLILSVGITLGDVVKVQTVPSGADIYVNGEYIGESPYNWTNPDYGQITLELKKSGYADVTHSIEYMGGAKVVKLSLEKSATSNTQQESPASVKKSNPSMEDRIWEAAKKENTTGAYSTYLKLYPNGEYKMKALSKFKKIRGTIEGGFSFSTEGIRLTVSEFPKSTFIYDTNLDQDFYVGSILPIYQKHNKTIYTNRSINMGPYSNKMTTIYYVQKKSVKEIVYMELPPQPQRVKKTSNVSQRDEENRRAEQARRAEEERRREAERIAERQRRIEEARKKDAQRSAADEKVSNEVQAGLSASIFFSSLPPVADIYEDGKLVGKTNMAPIKTTSGKHTYRFKKGDRTAVTTIVLKSGKNNHPMIRLK